MILTRVRGCLKERGAATISQLVAALAEDRAMVEAALQYWCRRGDAHPIAAADAPPACGLACRGCPLSAVASPRQAPPVAYGWGPEA